MKNKTLICKGCSREIDVSSDVNPESIVEVLTCESCDKSWLITKRSMSNKDFPIYFSKTEDPSHLNWE